jgi:MerR family transcriptional regulator, light-induced transcriptional regulator
MVATGPLSVARARAADRPVGALVLPFDTAPLRPWPDFTPPSRVDHRADEHARLLASVIERDVVPRLAERPLTNLQTPGEVLPQDTVTAFAALVVGGDVARTLAFAERAGAMLGGMSRVHLALLAPTARYLGHLWDIDRLDFTEVTIGLGRLHHVLRALGPAFQAGAALPRPGRLALLLAPIGEQHLFGLAMVREFFRRAAWDVWSGAPANDAELCAIVRDNEVGIVGFSVAGSNRLDAVRASIVAVRRASWNRRIAIMVGGPAFIEHPEHVAQVGADAMALDGDDAVKQAETLVAGVAPRN